MNPTYSQYLLLTGARQMVPACRHLDEGDTAPRGGTSSVTSSQKQGLWKTGCSSVAGVFFVIKSRTTRSARIPLGCICDILTNAGRSTDIYDTLILRVFSHLNLHSFNERKGASPPSDEILDPLLTGWQSVNTRSTTRKADTEANKKQCSRQLQCKVPCGVGNIVNASLFINSSLSSLFSTSHTAYCPWGRGYFSPAAIYCTVTWCFAPKGLRTTMSQTLMSESKYHNTLRSVLQSHNPIVRCALILTTETQTARNAPNQAATVVEPGVRLAKVGHLTRGPQSALSRSIWRGDIF